MVAIRVTAFHFMKRLRSRQQGDPGVSDVLDVWDLVSDLVMRQLFLVGFSLYAIGFAEERNEQINKGLKDGSLEKGVYRGLGGYKQLGIIFIVLPYCFSKS